MRGLSTRDVEGLFEEVFGEKIISKGSVSQLSQTLVEEFDGWRKRDLSELKLVYLFLDATYLPLRQGTEEKEGLLCAYGLTEEGRMVFIHLGLGSRESYDSWLGFFHDMTSRGLNEPLLIISDGHRGLRKALGEVFPGSIRQRCQVHKMRNILCKLPRGVIREMKRHIQQVFLAPDYEAARRRGRLLIARFRSRYPSAMECLERDLEECIAYLKFPKEHHRRIRTTNLLERTFGEGKLKIRLWREEDQGDTQVSDRDVVSETGVCHPANCLQKVAWDEGDAKDIESTQPHERGTLSHEGRGLTDCRRCLCLFTFTGKIGLDPGQRKFRKLKY